MHLCTVRPCAWLISRQLQLPRGHVRWLSGFNAASTSLRNEENLGNTKSGRKSQGRKSSGRYNAEDEQRERNMQDLIFLDDLLATLDAHRNYNRGPRIPKLRQRADEAILPFKRPLLDSASSENAKTTSKRRDDKIDIKGQNSTSVREPSPSQGPVRRVLQGRGVVRRIEVTADQAGAREGSVTAEDPQHEPHTRQWPADSVQNVEEGSKRNTGFARSVEPLEYKSAVIPIKELWEWTGANPSTISTPWVPYMEDDTGDNHERLSSEIRAFEAYMSLSPAEEAAAQLVHSDITLALRGLLSTKSLTLLGSRGIGLAAPTSDFNYRIDIDTPKRSATNKSPEMTTNAAKNTREFVLEGIWGRLKKSKDIATTKLVFAPVPIIKCRHRATGLRIQFEVMEPSQASQQYTAAYLHELPSLRPLYILVRHFLEIRGLTAVSQGGLGSYTILMMIVVALKNSGAKILPDDLGGQLLHVLNFYGNTNLCDFGFSVEPPRIFNKRKPKQSRAERSNFHSDPQFQGMVYLTKCSRGGARRHYLLCLQDPADAYNDLGRPSYAIKHIQLIFRNMRTFIEKHLFRQRLTQESEDSSFLAPMVRADYSSFEITRRDIEHCNTPDAGLNPEDVDEDTISALLERRLKTYRRVMEADSLPSNLADSDSPGNSADANPPSDPADTDLPSTPPEIDVPSTPAGPDSPSNPVDTDSKPGLITKYNSNGWGPNEYYLKPGLITKYRSTGWYPNEYIFEKQKRSRRQIDARTARMVAKRREWRNKAGADTAKDEAPVAEQPSDGNGERTLPSNDANG